RLAPALGDCRVTELATLTAEPAAPAAPPAPTALPAPAARTAHADPDDTAWIIHTSGTTGLPKGACLTHRSLLAAVLNTAMARPLADDDVYLFPFPLCHVAGYNVVLFHRARRPVVIARQFTAASLVEQIGRVIADFRASLPAATI
ncbi:MAG TPA: AMP-binding protein, partial [Microthrixaceae bacterium]|nr:AMP-binding protein [Microthrixaceae bacterium]